MTINYDKRNISLITTIITLILFCFIVGILEFFSIEEADNEGFQEVNTIEVLDYSMLSG